MMITQGAGDHDDMMERMASWSVLWRRDRVSRTTRGGGGGGGGLLEGKKGESDKCHESDERTRLSP